MRRSLLVSVALGALLGCGEGEPQGEATSTPDPAAERPREAIVLRVALQSEIAGIDTLLVPWTESHGAEVSVEVRDDPWNSSEEFSLVELEAIDLGDAAAAGHVRAVEDWGTGSTPRVGDPSAEWRGQRYGLPWRGRVHGLLLPPAWTPEEADSWSKLARRAQGAGGLALLENESGVGCFELLGLSVANGADFSGEELRLDEAPTLEALAFLARLHGRGRRFADRAALSSHVAAGGIGAGWWTSAPGGVPWPAPTASGEEGAKATAFVEPRLLCVPRGAPYVDLAISLAAELDRLAATTVDAGWQSLREDRLPPAAYSSLTARVGLRRAVDAWSEAVTAVLDRRRSAEDALGRAQERWMTAEMHGP